jgi:L-fucose isomerase-like protein
MPVFLLGAGQSLIGKDQTEQNAKSDAILNKLGLSKEVKIFVREEEDLLGINIHEADSYVIFPYCAERFSALIYLAETKLPIIIFSEEETFDYALDTYEYLSDHENVQIASSPKEVEKFIKILTASKWLRNMKICLFDTGEWKLGGVSFLKTPIFYGRLNTQSIDKGKFLEAYRNADRKRAESLARKWMEEAEVREPSFEDVVKSARVYLAMKTAMEAMRANVAYVLWCGQFTKELETKMCFALAKLADDGVPVGCWRGENLLPMIILHRVSGKPVFVCEAFKRHGNTITVRHCFAPGTIASCRYTLRRWRDMVGTVTGYCQLPKGEVTLVNCGIGDKLAVTNAEVVDCRDLEGDNCRMTVWLEIANKAVRKLVGRECALVYGDYVEEAKAAGEKLGLRVL